jgi:hypothetical protein
MGAFGIFFGVSWGETGLRENDFNFSKSSKMVDSRRGRGNS